MKRPGTLILASAAFCLGCVVLNGCSSSDSGTSDEGLFPLKKGPAVVELLKEVKYDGEATISGRVTYDGDPPARPEISAIAGNADRSVCMAGGANDTTDPTWMVGSDKGVANVVVYVKVAKGFYFKKPDDKAKAWPDEVIVDQPYCAFRPHVTALYPEYYDGKTYTKTGQVLKVLNTASIGHNIKVGGSSDVNPVKGGTLSAKSGQYLFDGIRLDRDKITMNCDIHKWMTGYALTFDHPYFAVTKPDGTFEIKNVPAGTELVIKAWHEELKHFDPTSGGTKFTLKKGDTQKLDFSVKKK
jgi:hypothetical protein